VNTTYGALWAFEDDYITEQIRKFGNHTRPEIAFLLSIVAPGDAVFDLGAHIGTFSIALAQRIGVNGRLLAVEAEPQTYALLCRNLQALRNRVTSSPNIHVVRGLIASGGQSYVAVTPEGNTGGTMFLADDSSGSSMPTIGIDGLVKRFFAPRVIKMDIEGGEAAALAAAAVLDDLRPIVYSEVNGTVLARQGASIDQMEGVLLDLGYRLFRNVGPRRAADDRFEVVELQTLPRDLNNFDVMAVHRHDDRLDLMTRSGA
jgi:FkbM family methyltransferase